MPITAHGRGVDCSGLDFSQICLVQIVLPIQSTVEKLWKMLRKKNKTKQSLATNKAITSLIYSGTRFVLFEQFFFETFFFLFSDGSSIKIMKLKLMAEIVPKRGKYTKRWTFQLLQPTIGCFGK